MKIMRERAERIGASIALKSSAAQGTSVTLTLPPHPVAGNPVDTAGPKLNFQPRATAQTTS